MSHIIKFGGLTPRKTLACGNSASIKRRYSTSTKITPTISPKNNEKYSTVKTRTGKSSLPTVGSKHFAENAKCFSYALLTALFPFMGINLLRALLKRRQRSNLSESAYIISCNKAIFSKYHKGYLLNGLPRPLTRPFFSEEFLGAQVSPAAMFDKMPTN